MYQLRSKICKSLRKRPDNEVSIQTNDGHKVLRYSTDSEDFTSDSGAVRGVKTDTDEAFVLAVHEKLSFEPDLSLGEPSFGMDTGTMVLQID